MRSPTKQLRNPPPEADDAGEPEAEVVGGVGAVEGDEVIEAEEAAPEVHDAAVEGAEEAAAVAEEVADEPAEEARSPSPARPPNRSRNLRRLRNPRKQRSPAAAFAAGSGHA